MTPEQESKAFQIEYSDIIYMSETIFDYENRKCNTTFFDRSKTPLGTFITDMPSHMPIFGTTTTPLTLKKTR